jgi:hypothetical protein
MKVFQLSPATEWRPKVAHGGIVGFVVNMNQAPERGGRFFFRPIFCRPIRGLKFFFAIQPTVSPWATFCRASGALVALILFFAVGATAETTNTLSDAEIQGRQLAQKICESRPTENFENTAVMQIRQANGIRTNIPIRIETVVTETNWQNFFAANFALNNASNSFYYEGEVITVIHTDKKQNQYGKANLVYSGTKFKRRISDVTTNRADQETLFGSEIMSSFANSDFWIADLGLEFFHWPQQKVLKKEVHRSCGCTVLESTNPNPSTNGYSRVVSWIDSESLGIVEAYAYDLRGKLLKDFYPKNLKKVNGQYQVETMIMENVQTDSRTRLEFDLKK